MVSTCPGTESPRRFADLVRRLDGEGGFIAAAWLAALGPRVAVRLDEDDVRRAARPWLAMVDAVGAGAKLTAAGYLPPAVVEQIAEAAGVTSWWIGKVNREDLTWPVAALWEAAQDVGLLRKTKGRLLPTARAKATGNQPRRLVDSVLERLPIGKGFAQDAGWFVLLGLAVGESGDTVHAGVAQMLTDLGWRTRAGSAVSPNDARHAARPMLSALESMAGEHNATDSALLRRLARAALLGVEDAT